MDSRASNALETKWETKAQARFIGCTYDLCLLPMKFKDLEQDELLKRLERNKLYIENINGQLKYTVVQCNEREDGSPVYRVAADYISAAELNNKISSPLPSPFDVDELKPLLFDILKITSQRGHTRPIENNLKFETWYEPTTIERLLFLVPPNKHYLKPYVVVDNTSVNPTELFYSQLKLLQNRLLKSSADIQTFIAKPQIGADHYYGGAIFKDPDNSGQTCLYLFNPLGVYKKIEDFLQKVKATNMFSKVYLSTTPVQSERKDGDKLVSCGPISLDFVNYLHADNNWINKLTTGIFAGKSQGNVKVFFIDAAELGLLPTRLIELADENKSAAYVQTMLNIRAIHFGELKKIATDMQYNLASEIEILGFDDETEEKKGLNKKDQTIRDLNDDFSLSEDDASSYAGSDQEEDNDETEEENDYFDFPDPLSEQEQNNQADTIQAQKDLIETVKNLQQECEVYKAQLTAHYESHIFLRKKNIFNEKLKSLQGAAEILSTINEKTLEAFVTYLYVKKQTFQADSDKAGIKFLKNVGKLLATIFTGGRYYRTHKKPLVSFWKSNEEVQGNEFFTKMHEQISNKKKPK